MAEANAQRSTSNAQHYKWESWRENSPVEGWDKWFFYRGGYSDNEDGYWARIYAHVDGGSNPDRFAEIAVVPSGKIANAICEARNST